MHAAGGRRRPPAAGAAAPAARSWPCAGSTGSRSATGWPPTTRRPRSGHRRRPSGCRRRCRWPTRADPRRGRRRRARRWRCGTGPCWRSSTAPGRASPRPSAWTSTTSTCDDGDACCCAARAARNGWCRSARYAARGASRPTWSAAGPRSRPRGPRRRRRVFLNARGGRLPGRAPGRCSAAAERAGVDRRGLPAHAAALVRHPPARRRRRRPGRPGAARARLGDHHAGLHAGHRRQPARGLRDRAPAGPGLTGVGFPRLTGRPVTRRACARLSRGQVGQSPGQGPRRRRVPT